MRFRILAFLFASVVLMYSCNNGWDSDEQKVIDHQIIEQYVKENNLNGEFRESGLYCVIYDTGTVAKPTINSNVTVKYKGYYTDGELLDEGTIKSYPLSSLIRGWQEGITLIGKGGKEKLVIPSHLAYGHNPQNDVRSDAVLVFDVELIDFDN